MNLRQKLVHENALVLSLAATLLLMGRHVYHVYHAGLWGLIAAAGLSVATMQFILRGHERRGYAFAALDMVYNLAFFDLLTPLLRRQLTAEQAPELLLSFAIPVVLACYAHDYARKPQATKQEQEAPAAQEQEQPRQQQPASPLLTLLVQEQGEQEQAPMHPCKHPGCSFTGSNRQQLAAHSRKHRIAIAAD